MFSNHNFCRLFVGGVGQIITFGVAKKSLIYSLFGSIYGICGGRWLVKTSYEGEKGLNEKVRIPSYGGGGIKLLKKLSYEI